MRSRYPSPGSRRARSVALAAVVVPGLAFVTACSPLASPSIVTTTPQDSGGGQGGSSTQSAKPQAVPAAKRWRPGQLQQGLQVYAHNANGQPADANLEHILDYVVRLGANSVAYSFPIYTNGQRPTRVYAGKDTPTPAVMARMVAAAHARGLRVTLRPLIDEANLRTPSGGWRGTIQPPNLSSWFSSYFGAIKPYLAVADKAGADEFVLAAELTSLQPQHRSWRTLAERAGRVFPRTLSYTFNFDSNDTSMVPPHGSAGLDMYFDVGLGPDATVDELTRALVEQIMAKPKALRSSMVAQEVGIAAENGAYRHPWNWGDPHTKNVNPAIQVNWFTAACKAVKRTNLDGIYYWMLDSSVDPTQVNPTTEGSAGFVGRPGAKAIQQCFSGTS